MLITHRAMRRNQKIPSNCGEPRYFYKNGTVQYQQWIDILISAACLCVYQKEDILSGYIDK